MSQKSKKKKLRTGNFKKRRQDHIQRGFLAKRKSTSTTSRLK